MLIYDHNDHRTSAVVNYLNEGLDSEHLCIYASINASDILHMSSISSYVVDYESNLKDGNLVIIDLKPYYESALAGDLTPFNELKTRLEDMLINRLAKAPGKDRNRNNNMLIVANAAENLSEIKNFDECARLEGWWQLTHTEWIRNGLNITLVCPHWQPSFEEKKQQRHYRRVLSPTLSLSRMSEFAKPP